MSQIRARRTRRIIPAFLVLLTVVSVGIAAQHVHITEATWNDHEWGSAAPNSMGTLNCGSPIAQNQLATRAEGRFLSGSVQGLDSSTIAGVAGTHVTNNGSRTLVTPASASPVTGQTDAYAHSFSPVVLGATHPNLAPLLAIPVGTPAGVLGQFGQAQSTGFTRAASGLITNSGAIDLSGQPAPPTNVASLNLSQLLNSVGLNLGTLVSNVTDVNVEVGAVASTAALDGCANVWSGNVTGLTRDYQAASAQVVVTSPAVGALVSTLNTVVTNLSSTVAGIAPHATGGTCTAPTVQVQCLTQSVTTLVNGLINNPLLSLGSVEITSLSVTLVQPERLTNYLAAPFSDARHIVTVHPAQGTVSINTAALLGAAYPGVQNNTLNGLHPNTNVLADTLALQILTDTLTALLSDWVSGFGTLLQTVIADAVVIAQLKINLIVELLGVKVPLASAVATVNGSVSALRSGQVLAVVATPPNLPILGAILSDALSAVLSGLAQSLGALIGNAVWNTLTAVATVNSVTPGATIPIVTAVESVYRGLFVSKIFSLTVNSQNRPVSGPAQPARPIPGDPPPDWNNFPSGRFDVAALRVGVLSEGGTPLLVLYLARSSVGTSCVLPVQNSACSGY